MAEVWDLRWRPPFFSTDFFFSYGFPDDDCDQDCLVAEAVASGMYDLIIGVSFRYGGAISAAATDNPDVNFGVVDVAYDPILPNVEQFTWAEDESGFLAGVVAGEVAKSLGLTVLGGVGGIAIPPVKKFINGFAVGAQDVCPECPIYEVYSNSFGSLEEGEAHADLFLENGVQIAFCAGGYTGSMACKKLAENGVYVIGVDTDEFYTTFESGDAVGSEFLLTSALKSTARAVTFAVQCFLFNFDDCAGKNNLLNAGNGGIGTAPCHEACEVYDEDIQAKVADLYQALADQAISTGVDPMGELIVSDIVELSSP